MDNTQYRHMIFLRILNCNKQIRTVKMKAITKDEIFPIIWMLSYYDKAENNY